MKNPLNFIEVSILCIGMTFGSICGQDKKTDSEDNSALPLIDSLISSQASVRSISCNYHQKRWLNNVGPT
jgi:hypothetical protein